MNKDNSINTAIITAVGGFLPDYRLTNKELESLVDTNDEWIVSRTGIKERRISKDPNQATSDLAVNAIKNLIEKKNIDPEEIECIICCTMTPDMQLTVTAAYIAWKLGAKNAWGYDFTAACSGFLYGLTTAASYIESGRYKKVIVVGADKMSSHVDYTDRNTCILFGDGGAAVLVEPGKNGMGVMKSHFACNGYGRNLMHQKAGGSLLPASLSTVAAGEHYAYMDGKAVFRFAITYMTESIFAVLKANMLQMEDIDWIVPHQANQRIIEAVAHETGCPLEKIMLNIENYGNTIAGTIPLCLWEWENKLKEGDNIILVSFGGGFTWGATLLKWAYNS